MLVVHCWMLLFHCGTKPQGNVEKNHEEESNHENSIRHTDFNKKRFPSTLHNAKENQPLYHTSGLCNVIKLTPSETGILFDEESEAKLYTAHQSCIDTFISYEVKVQRINFKCFPFLLSCNKTYFSVFLFQIKVMSLIILGEEVFIAFIL